MKILLVVNLCAHYRVKLFELLDKKYDIRCLFFSKGEKYYHGEKHLGDFDGEYLWGFNIVPKFRFNPKLLYVLMSYPYTHIIAGISGSLPLFLTFVISKIRRKKFILWTGIWHHPRTIFHKLSFLFVKLIYKHSDAIIVYGPHVKKYLGSLGIEERKISIAWQVQDNSKFKIAVSDNKKNKLKSSLGIKTSKIILFVGKLTVDKGILFLVNAFNALSYNNASLLIIGRGPLEKRIKLEADNNNKIIHLSKVSNDELYRYYAISDIFVLPSVTTKTFKEPWGFVVNEAMNQGCAVITSDAVGAGAGGLVQNSVTGLIVPEKNSLALKEKVEYLIKNDLVREKMGENAKEEISKWTYERMAGGFVKAINYVEKQKFLTS